MTWLQAAERRNAAAGGNCSAGVRMAVSAATAVAALHSNWRIIRGRMARAAAGTIAPCHLESTRRRVRRSGGAANTFTTSRIRQVSCSIKRLRGMEWTIKNVANAEQHHRIMRRKNAPPIRFVHADDVLLALIRPYIKRPRRCRVDVLPGVCPAFNPIALRC